MLDAVLFDLDGTLADTAADLLACMNVTLARFDLPPKTEGDILALMGKAEREYVRAALTESLIAERGEDFFEEVSRFYAAQYEAHFCDLTAPYPGIAAALDEIRQMGLRLGVVSNKGEAFVAAITEHLFPGRFGAVSGSGTLPPKPDPALPNKVARMLRVHPSRCALVGDTPTDITAALNAGMVPIGVTWGYRPEILLRRAGASVLCHAPDELPDAVRLCRKGLVL